MRIRDSTILEDFVSLHAANKSRCEGAVAACSLGVMRKEKRELFNLDIQWWLVEQFNFCVPETYQGSLLGLLIWIGHVLCCQN